MRAYIYVTILLIVIFGAIAGYLYQRFSAFAAMDFSPPPVTIAAAEATVSDWTKHLDAVGTLKAVRGVELTSETSGEVTSIHFDSGDKVKAGQLLVVLNDHVEQASRQNQIAALELAEVLFSRDSTLIAQKSIPQSQYDRSKADLARARAQLDETEARLENKRITAPFGGNIGIRHVDVGDYLSPGTIIASLQDTSELEIDLTVPARYASELKEGLTASLTVDAYPARLFTANIAAIDTRVDSNTRTILLRARLNEIDGLYPGMFASIRIDLGVSQTIITVPETALTYSLQGDRVYIVQPLDEGGLTAVTRIVESGEVRDGRVSILSGLEAGEQVATAGQNKLYRGVKILVADDRGL